MKSRRNIRKKYDFSTALKSHQSCVKCKGLVRKIGRKRQFIFLEGKVKLSDLENDRKSQRGKYRKVSEIEFVET